MPQIKSITDAGLSFANTKAEQRNVRLTNYISLISVAATLILLASRFIFAFVNVPIALTLILGSVLFFIPIILNRFGFTQASRLALCWIPSAYQLFAAVLSMGAMVVPESSAYVGLRFFIIGFSCFPFLVFDFKQPRLFFLGLAGPVLTLALFDPVLNFFGVGIYQVGLTDHSYYFNNVRTAISMMIIGSSLYFLKRLVERNEILNDQLVEELASKNKFIQEQADAKLHASEKRFSKVFENYPDFIMVVRETDLLVMDVNPKITPVMGFEKSEVIGRSARYMNLFLSEDERQQYIKSYDNTGYTEYECQWNRKDGRIIDVKITGIRMDIDGQYYRMSVVQDVTEIKQAEKEKEHARYLLKERIKELTTLYSVSQLLSSESKSLDEIFSALPVLLPPGWQYPEVCASRLTVFNKQYESPNFEESEFKLTQELRINNVPIGILEVVYLQEKPTESEGPFFVEERNLIHAIAEMVQIYIVRKQREEDLNKAQANLEATINNTELMIWSVDRNFDLVTFNESFARFNRKTHNIEIKSGANHKNYYGDAKSEKWNIRFTRALSGERFIEEETVDGNDFSFSVSPIIEKGKITGVTIFANNITELKRQNNALVEANKKIGELRVMALRSVMNPHFIFNVLNSIQFFIASNDRENAINYLSTFSKLIRMVLTHSVADTITLTDELEMLKNYIQLEKVRFEDKFEFIFEIDDSVDPDDTHIPSLLIQPYVENAILHGLYNKAGKGRLIIRIKETNEEYLVVEIEDDGVGREAAAKLRNQNQPAHKSMGTKLTEERLKLINEQSGVGVSFTDLYTDADPAGTRVTINIKSY